MDASRSRIAALVGFGQLTQYDELAIVESEPTGFHPRPPRRWLAPRRFSSRARSVTAPPRIILLDDARLAQVPELSSFRINGGTQQAIALATRRPRAKRQEGLAPLLALDRFRRRPPISALPIGLRREFPASFGSYTDGCRRADHLLFRSGDAGAVDDACRRSPAGRLRARDARSARCGRGSARVRLAAGVGRGDRSSPHRARHSAPQSQGPGRRSGPGYSMTPQRSAPGPAGPSGSESAEMPSAGTG